MSRERVAGGLEVIARDRGIAPERVRILRDAVEGLVSRLRRLGDRLQPADAPPADRIP